MLRITAIALAMVAASTAQIAYAADKKPNLATPSDFGCAVRMMFLGSKARDSAKEATKTPEDRAKAEKMALDARRSFYYYIGRLGPQFSAVNRSEEGKQVFNAMMSAPKDTLAMEMAVCMTNVEKAELDLLTAMKPPIAK